MANRYKRGDVLFALYNKAKEACDRVYTSRPIAIDQMQQFVVVTLPQGIRPYADTHNTAYVQMTLFVRDKQNGIEDVEAEEQLIDDIVNLCPFDNALMSCNEKPIILQSKSDGMGFHSTIIQFKIVIKV